MSADWGRSVTGRPCRRCGGVERSARTGRCMACEREYANAANARRRAEIGDEAFRARKAEAVRRHRADPANRAKVYAVTTARHRALERLAEAHPEELERYLDRERALLGLPPKVRR